MSKDGTRGEVRKNLAWSELVLRKIEFHGFFFFLSFFPCYFENFGYKFCVEINFLDYIPKKGIAGSYAYCMFNFLRKLIDYFP
jgi:hypothetical protein